MFWAIFSFEQRNNLAHQLLSLVELIYDQAGQIRPGENGYLVIFIRHTTILLDWHDRVNTRPALRDEFGIEGAVNTTISFFYNARERSLTQEEVNERQLGLNQELERRFGWKG